MFSVFEFCKSAPSHMLLFCRSKTWPFVAYKRTSWRTGVWRTGPGGRSSPLCGLSSKCSSARSRSVAKMYATAYLSASPPFPLFEIIGAIYLFKLPQWRNGKCFIHSWEAIKYYLYLYLFLSMDLLLFYFSFVSISFSLLVSAWIFWMMFFQAHQKH